MPPIGKRKALIPVQTRECIAAAEERIARLEKTLTLNAPQRHQGTLHVEAMLGVFKGELASLLDRQRRAASRYTGA
jgi:hypothetical protein